MNNINDLRKKSGYGWYFAVIFALILAFAVLSVFESIIVIGDSMLPNYVGGKVDSNNHITVKGDKVIVSKWYNLEYGDVVVFYNDKLQSNLIKRVIGLGGDTIEIRYNQVYRNGEKLTEEYIKEPMRWNADHKWIVPEGYVFVMGDNRNNSEDSRGFGAIDKSCIIGEVVIRITVDGRIFFV